MLFLKASSRDGITLIGDASGAGGTGTDNWSNLMGALTTMGNNGGGTLKVYNRSGLKIGVSHDIIIPKGVRMENWSKSTKLSTDESVGMIFVPLASYTPTTIATSSVGGTISAVGGSSPNYNLVSTGNVAWPGTFQIGMIVTVSGGAGGAVPTNCQILQIKQTVNPGDTLLLTGGCTAGTIGTVNGFYGSIVAMPNTFSKIKDISADAGSTAARAIFECGQRNELYYPDAHGGTLCSLDSAHCTPSGSGSPLFDTPYSENTVHLTTVYAQQYGPYSARFAQADMEMKGGRLIQGTKAFTAQCAAPQVSTVHLTDATKSGPNVEDGSINGVFSNIVLDTVNQGTCYLQHLKASENFASNADQSTWRDIQVEIPSGSTAQPMIIEDDTLESITVRDWTVIGSSSGQVSTLVSFANGSNLAMDIDGIKVMANSMVDTTLLYLGGQPGREKNIIHNSDSGTPTVMRGDQTSRVFTQFTLVTSVSANQVIAAGTSLTVSGDVPAMRIGDIWQAADGSGHNQQFTCQNDVAAGAGAIIVRAVTVGASWVAGSGNYLVNSYQWTPPNGTKLLRVHGTAPGGGGGQGGGAPTAATAQVGGGGGGQGQDVTVEIPYTSGAITAPVASGGAGGSTGGAGAAGQNGSQGTSMTLSGTGISVALSGGGGGIGGASASTTTTVGGRYGQSGGLASNNADYTPGAGGAAPSGATGHTGGVGLGAGMGGGGGGGPAVASGNGGSAGSPAAALAPGTGGTSGGGGASGAAGAAASDAAATSYGAGGGGGGGANNNNAGGAGGKGGPGRWVIQVIG